jgi:hypothetical protein
MPDYALSLLWFASTLLFLILLSRWLNRHVQGVVLLVSNSADAAMYVSHIAFFPGIALHELSHWLAARLLGVRAGGISLWPKRAAKRQIHYGSVRIERVDALRRSLIGLAPFIAGSLAVFLFTRVGLGVMPLTMPRTLDDLLAYFAADDAPLWLYLIFAVSNAMMPSSSDREPWRPVLLFMAMITLLLIATDALTLIPPGVVGLILRGIDHVSYAFTLTIAVDLLFALLIFLLEGLLMLLFGRQVKY